MLLPLHCSDLWGGSASAASSVTSSAPAIYNDPSDNGSGTLSGDITAYVSLNGVNSSNVSTNANAANHSIINLDQYKSSSDTLMAHFVIKHGHSGTETIHSGIEFGTKPDRDTVKAAAQPNISYAGNGPVKGSFKPDLSSTLDNSSDIKLSYGTAADDYQSESTFNDWDKLTDIRIDGTLAPYTDYDLEVPLKLNNPDSVDTENLDNTFQVGALGYANDSLTSGPTSSNYLQLRFAKPLDFNTYFTPDSQNNKYLIYYDNITGSPIQAKDVQSLAPVINANKELAIDDFSVGRFPRTSDTQFFTGAATYVDLTKVKTLDGKSTLLDALHNNGYSYGTKANDLKSQIDHIVFTPTSPDDKNEAAIAMEGKNGLGNARISVMKVIDVKGANDQDQVTVNQGDSWDPKANVTIYNPAVLDESKSPIVNNPNVKIDGTVNTKVPGTYKVTYTYQAPYNDPKDGTQTIKKTVSVIVKGANTPSNNGGGGSSSNNSGSATTPTITTPNNNSGSTTTNGSSSSNSGSTTSNNNPVEQPNLPSYVTPKKAAVYAVKGIYMYKTPNFAKNQRIAKYPKAKRTNRPMFVVTNYARSNGGALRYKVRDVKTHKVGYITANSKYVVRVYYQTMPRNKKITVISKKGVNSYKHASLTSKVKHYKKGIRLAVKKLVKHGLSTRYQLTNGRYVTANKKLVIQGNY